MTPEQVLEYLDKLKELDREPKKRPIVSYIGNDSDRMPPDEAQRIRDTMRELCEQDDNHADR